MHFLKTDRILVVAPHPDDESIGCGGLLLKYGPQCDILVLADGRRGYNSKDDVDEDALVLTREQELRQAAALAGVNRIFHLRIPDYHVADSRETIAAFDISGYDVILTPNRAERQADHSAVTGFLQQMRDRQNPRAKLYEYEVWSPLPAPTHILDISDVMDAKLNMVSQHRSQLKYVDYRAMTHGLNQYRGAGFSCAYCEVFSLVPYRNRLQRLFDRLPLPIRSLVRGLRRLAAPKRKE